MLANDFHDRRPVFDADGDAHVRSARQRTVGAKHVFCVMDPSMPDQKTYEANCARISAAYWSAFKSDNR
jgi:hypothetical protein